MTNILNDELSIGLLRIVDTVGRTRNVSRAAEELAMSQPKVSVALARLRRQVGDPVFVRTGSGMAPTPTGERLLKAARQTLEVLTNALNQHSDVFDAARTTQRFTLAMNQITQMTLFPRMMERLAALAPQCQVQAVPINADSLEGLNTGTLDLAIGDISELHQGYFKRTVLRDEYMCLVSRAHPRISHTLSQEQFLAERHAVVWGAGTIMRNAEIWMQKKKISRNVQVMVPDFLGIDALVASSELIATVPLTLGKMFAASRQLEVLKHPFPLPRSTAKIYWHERNHRDSAQQWFRQLVIDTLLRHGQ